MRPIDFVIFDGGGTPNIPAHKIAEAMNKDIEIQAVDGEYEVLSYYFNDGVLILDIEKKVN